MSNRFGVLHSDAEEPHSEEPDSKVPDSDEPDSDEPEESQKKASCSHKKKKKKKKKKKPQNKISKKVDFFLDFENLKFIDAENLPEGEKEDGDNLSEIEGNFKRALASSGVYDYELNKVSGHGKIKHSNATAIEYLTMVSGFQLSDIATKTVTCDYVSAEGARCGKVLRSADLSEEQDPHERKTDIADLLIVKDALLAVIDHYRHESAPGNILVASNDWDIQKAMIDLQSQKTKVKVMIAVADETDPKKISWLKQLFPAGVWLWGNLKKGGRSE